MTRKLSSSIWASFSRTAAKSDRWIPVKPGTEGVLALGLAHVIIKEALYSSDFITNYTVGFKDFPEGNELDEASHFAKYLGTIHRNIVIDNLDFIKVLDEVAWFMDEPTATSSAVALYYLTKIIKEDVKVVLTGLDGEIIYDANQPGN